MHNMHSENFDPFVAADSDKLMTGRTFQILIDIQLVAEVVYKKGTNDAVNSFIPLDQGI